MVLKIFKATDAFLYLPTYVAEEFGIFDTMLKDLGITRVEFITPTEGSDIRAIERMISENRNSEDSISIAICDPTAFLSVRNDEEDYQQCRVIGSIINKLPFWAVNHLDKEFEKLEDLRNNFKTVVHYNNDLITGFYLGNKVKNKSKIRKSVIVKFGEEIPKLNQINKRVDKAVAVTADIISLAKGMNKTNYPLKINYRFSTEGKYLTTGIITTLTVCDKYPLILGKLIEGVQQSIYILYASNKIAERVCGILARNSKFSGINPGEELSAAEVTSIIKLIGEEKFYPADLDISREGWYEAVNALSKTEQWNSAEIDERVSLSFEKYVDNRFIHKSEKSIAEQFGITSETFQEEIDAKINTYLEKQRMYDGIEPFAISLAKVISLPIIFIKKVFIIKKRRLILYGLLIASGILLTIDKWRTTTQLISIIDYFWIITPVAASIIVSIVVNMITSPDNDK